MVLDILACLLLLALWIFGGAAFFDSQRTEYKNVLLGWSVLNAFVVGATILFIMAFWSIGRLYT